MFGSILKADALKRLVVPAALVFLAMMWTGCSEKQSPAETAPQAAEKKPVATQSRPESAQPPARKNVHTCTGAGRWYAADAEELSEQKKGYMSRSKADAAARSNLIAMILPHAGYQYSGPTAAFAVKSIGRQYRRVVVIGPSHYANMSEMLSVPRATHYSTPLGEIPLDVEFIEELVQYPMFESLPYAHQHEHSVQNELPLLQYKLEEFKLVPIVAGHCSYETITRAGRILKGLIDKDTLVVVSSDFVHYGAGYRYVPFTEDIEANIKKLDMDAFGFISAADSKGFWNFKQKTGATICGYIPITLLLSMLGESVEAELLSYTTSGELTGDYNNSVSYLSIVFCGSRPESEPVPVKSANAELTAEDKKKLLELARKTMRYCLEKKQVPTPADLGIEVSPAMSQLRAAFVTLKKESRLRGCIGDIFPRQPLYQSVIYNAISACLKDRRFPPVTLAECSDIVIEISALTVPRPVDSAEKIRIGTDGVVLSKDGKGAVFLPQVAGEQGWGLEEMLAHLSQKAGMAPDAWKDGAEFTVFQADVFGEKEI